MTSIISPYVGLGCGSLFLKNVRSGKRTAPLCWGNGLLATLVTGLVTALLLCALSHLWLPGFPMALVCAICLSDLILMRVIDLASFGFAASARMSKTAVQNTTMSFLRVIGIVVLAGRPSVRSPSSSGPGSISPPASSARPSPCSRAARCGECPASPSPHFGKTFTKDFYFLFFSISTSAQTIYNDIDKTMLARLSTFSATGVYAAAYRIIDTSLTPVRSLVSAATRSSFA